MRRAFPIAAVLLGSLLAVGVAEVILALAGHRPFRSVGKGAEEPLMHEPDPVLGWRNKPGRYEFPVHDDVVEITFLEDGSRRTAETTRDAERQLVVVGGSFTMGWAISDRETFAWKLQTALPAVSVKNWGTAAYGTHQCLLLLERNLPRLENPAIVIYGFIAHHETRNVATEDWLRMLSRSSPRGHVATPFVTVDGDRRLVRHPPTGYANWPLRTRSRLVRLLERDWMRWRARGRAEQGREVTERTLLEMQRVCERYGATLVVAILQARRTTKDRYVSLLERNGIVTVDCAEPMVGDLKVTGRGHPSGKLNTLWSVRLAAAVDELLARE